MNKTSLLDLLERERLIITHIGYVEEQIKYDLDMIEKVSEEEKQKYQTFLEKNKINLREREVSLYTTRMDIRAYISDLFKPDNVITEYEKIKTTTAGLDYLKRTFEGEQK